MMRWLITMQVLIEEPGPSMHPQTIERIRSWLSVATCEGSHISVHSMGAPHPVPDEPDPGCREFLEAEQAALDVLRDRPHGERLAAKMQASLQVPMSQADYGIISACRKYLAEIEPEPDEVSENASALLAELRRTG